jgi:hypothetical protein
MHSRVNYTQDESEYDLLRRTCDTCGEVTPSPDHLQTHFLFKHADPVALAIYCGTYQPSTEKPKPVIKPHVITVYRWNTGEGYKVSVEVWSGDPGESERLDDEIHSTKKSALKYCKERYPGIKVLYSTEATRKQAA